MPPSQFLGALLVGGANAPKNLGFYLALLAFGFSLWRSPAAVLRASIESPFTLPLAGLFAAGVWGSPHVRNASRELDQLLPPRQPGNGNPVRADDRPRASRCGSHQAAAGLGATRVRRHEPVADRSHYGPEIRCSWIRPPTATASFGRRGSSARC
ncbi:MAG: hypothetical protein MZW92_64630 [Comamonadaceae bacterium]|nr:hypothetical protein [Comamonadaceae bacterium]